MPSILMGIITNGTTFSEVNSGGVTYYPYIGHVTPNANLLSNTLIASRDTLDYYGFYNLIARGKI